MIKEVSLQDNSKNTKVEYDKSKRNKHYESKWIGTRQFLEKKQSKQGFWNSILSNENFVAKSPMAFNEIIW